MKPYNDQTEQGIRTFYQTLNERDKRLYAATEAMKLEHGGKSYISKLLGCSRTTIYAAQREISLIAQERSTPNRIRRPGGGRKRYDQRISNIDAAFIDVVVDHTGGDPMEVGSLWTHLSQREIQRRLLVDHGISVSQTVIRKLLKKHRLGRRKAQKKRQ